MYPTIKQEVICIIFSFTQNNRNLLAHKLIIQIMCDFFQISGGFLRNFPPSRVRDGNPLVPRRFGVPIPLRIVGAGRGVESPPAFLSALGEREGETPRNHVPWVSLLKISSKSDFPTTARSLLLCRYD